MTNFQIDKWLSAERLWSASIKWMHTQNRRISLSTLRRALALPSPKTERQRLAIDLAMQYYRYKTGTATTPAPDITIPGSRTSVPVL